MQNNVHANTATKKHAIIVPHTYNTVVCTVARRNRFTRSGMHHVSGKKRVETSASQTYNSKQSDNTSDEYWRHTSAVNRTDRDSRDTGTELGMGDIVKHAFDYCH